MKNFKCVRFLAAFFVGSVLSLAVGAQNSESGKVQKRAVELEEFRIEGDIQKPEAFFILQHRNFDELLNSQTLAKFDAIELIVDAVYTDVF